VFSVQKVLEDSIPEVATMKVSILIRGLEDSSRFWPKYHGRSICRLALVTGLLSLTLGRSGWIEAQTQTQTQPQTQQIPTASPSDAGQVNSPDVPTANTTQQPKPEANDIPVLKTSVNVTDSISESSPANISVLSNQTLQTDPGVSLDDELRIIPGFSLLRRTSGVVASVTIQGVALRGLGLAGPSRALVLSFERSLRRMDQLDSHCS
jgi:hypothetical protein